MCFFFFSSRRRHTRCALVTGVQTCALPISLLIGQIERSPMMCANEAVERGKINRGVRLLVHTLEIAASICRLHDIAVDRSTPCTGGKVIVPRSEESRVGNACASKCRSRV